MNPRYLACVGRSLVLLVVLLLIDPLTVNAQLGTAYEYPVKSINLDNALSVVYYGLVSSETATVVDAHPVHGCKTSDGGYVAVGKGVEKEGSAATEAFAVKVDSKGKFLWAWKSGLAGKDGANAVAEVSSVDIAVVGYSTRANVTYRTIWKINAATGKLVWTATGFGDSAGSYGAYEMIEVDTTSAYVSGIFKLNQNDELSFKSYGNTEGGQAIVQKFPLSAIAATYAPTSSNVSWSVPVAAYGSAKAARVIGSNLAVLLWGKAKPYHCALQMLNPSTGATIWGPREYSSTMGEGTDVQAAANGKSLVIAGMGGSIGIQGQILNVNASNGTVNWLKSYSAGGNPKIILNECWGALALSDGYAMSCGTGIEDGSCDSLSEPLKSNCSAGKGDSREGAYPRKPGIWQSLLVRTDLNGTLIWQRVDSYRGPDEKTLKELNGQTSSSASEWIFADGNDFVAINDEVGGAGFLKLGKSQAPTLAPSVTTPAPSVITPDSSVTTPKPVADPGQVSAGFVNGPTWLANILCLLMAMH